MKSKNVIVLSLLSGVLVCVCVCVWSVFILSFLFSIYITKHTKINKMK